MNFPFKLLLFLAATASLNASVTITQDYPTWFPWDSTPSQTSTMSSDSGTFATSGTTSDGSYIISSHYNYTSTVGTTSILETGEVGISGSGAASGFSLLAPTSSFDYQIVITEDVYINFTSSYSLLVNNDFTGVSISFSGTGPEERAFFNLLNGHMTGRYIDDEAEHDFEKNDSSYFSLLTPGTYKLSIQAQSAIRYGDSTSNQTNYSLSTNFEAVPEPKAFELLFSGIGFFILIKAKKCRTRRCS